MKSKVLLHGAAIILAVRADADEFIIASTKRGERKKEETNERQKKNEKPSTLFNKTHMNKQSLFRSIKCATLHPDNTIIKQPLQPRS
jgi:hypothetical protein